MERKMLNIKLQDRVRAEKIRERAEVTDVVKHMQKQKWKCAGHLARMKDNRWTKRCTEWQPRMGRGREDQRRDGWMTSGKRRAQQGRGKRKTGWHARHLQRATSCSG